MELEIEGIVYGAGAWAGVQLPCLTRLYTSQSLERCAPLRTWAPALHTLEVAGLEDAFFPDGGLAGHPALRRLVFRGDWEGEAEPHAGNRHVDARRGAADGPDGARV